MEKCEWAVFRDQMPCGWRVTQTKRVGMTSPQQRERACQSEPEITLHQATSKKKRMNVQDLRNEEDNQTTDHLHSCLLLLQTHTHTLDGVLFAVNGNIARPPCLLFILTTLGRSTSPQLWLHLHNNRLKLTHHTHSWYSQIIQTTFTCQIQACLLFTPHDFSLIMTQLRIQHVLNLFRLNVDQENLHIRICFFPLSKSSDCSEERSDATTLMPASFF